MTLKKYLLAFMLLPLFADAVEMPQMTTEEACLSKAIQMEAENQSVKGQLSVVAVIFNRMKKQHISACQVVMQSGQFSWYSGKQSLTPTGRSVRFIPMARQALFDRANGNFVDYTQGATHFHTRTTRPWWSNNKIVIKICEIGDHVFYKVKES